MNKRVNGALGLFSSGVCIFLLTLGPGPYHKLSEPWSHWPFAPWLYVYIGYFCFLTLFPTLSLFCLSPFPIWWNRKKVALHELKEVAKERLQIDDKIKKLNEREAKAKRQIRRTC